jgi:hypothetical protein
MTALTGRTPASSYKDLLQVSNSNAGVDATVRLVSDGEATDSALQLSTGVVGSTGYIYHSVAVPAAAGSVQGDATALTKDFNAVTGADGTKGVILPTAVAASSASSHGILVVNTSASAVLKVYPASGGTINALSADAAFSLGPDRAALFVSSSTTQWYTPGVGGTTITSAQMTTITAGTAAASKVAILGTDKNLDEFHTAALYLGAGAGTLVGATAAEIDQVADISAYQETVAAAGALSIVKRVSKLAVTGGGAVTLAVPDATDLGYIKLIEMTTDDGDVTLALTNIEGQSSGTTATFNSVGDKLILLAGVDKWVVLKEQGIALS